MAPSPPPSPAASLSHARWWRIGQTAGAQAVAKVVSGISQLAIVPLLLHHLGTENFGWLMALVALAGLVQFADLGVQTALQHELAEAWSRGDESGLRKIYVAGGRVLTLLGLAWCGLALPLAWWLGPRLVATPGGGPAHGAWIVLVIAICAAVRISAGAKLAAAIQAGWIPAVWSAAANAMAVLACLLATRSGGGLALFLFILTAALVLPGAFAEWQAGKKLGWQRSAAPAVDAGLARRLWRSGLQFAPANLSGGLLLAAVPVALVRFGGYEASATFATLQRLFGPVAHAHSLAIGPLWPAYTEARARRDDAWVHRAFRISLGATLAAAAVIVALAALLPWIAPWWLGAGAVRPPPAFMWLLVAWNSAAMVVSALTYFLLGHGVMARLSPMLTWLQLLTLAAVIPLGARWGATGVAAALLAGLVFGQLPVLARACEPSFRPAR